MRDIATAFDVYKHEGKRLRITGRPSNLLHVRQIAEAFRAAHARSGSVGDYDTPLAENDTPVVAYVNHGRLLIDCTCGNGVPTSPPASVTEAVCFSCGTIWTNIVFPRDFATIIDVLRERPLAHTRNWRTPETISDLRAENAQKARR